MNTNIPLTSELMRTNIKNLIHIDALQKLNDDIFKYFLEGTLFIVADDKQLFGILTDGDVRKNVAKNNLSNIENFITQKPITIREEEEASVALRLLRENQVNILPVINKNNQLTGYITLHMLLSNFSPERLYITQSQKNADDNENRHLARYKFAKNFIKKGSYCLDCACGSGYGSKILSNNSTKILGVDLSQDAISFAKKNHETDNIKFMQSDLDRLDFEKETFDSIVSIETLEHVPHSVFLNFLDNIEKWLKNGGVFIGSSPMLRYKDGKPYITNPYHINEMSKNDFISSIKSKLKNFKIHFYYQDEDVFLPLCEEHTGFCVVIARKN